MAGFDFDFTYEDRYATYVEACIAAAKSRAHKLRCRWRTEWLPDVSGRRCIIDGQTRRLDLLGRALELDLPTVCEGVRAGLAPHRARQVGTAFAELYLIGRDVNLGDRLQTLRPRTDTSLYYPVYEVAPGHGTPLLRARLRLTEDVLTDFGLGRYPRAAVLEELHTALEHVFRELLPDIPTRANWPSLLKAAEQRKLIANSLGDWAREAGHQHTDLALLGGLNKRRREGKHRSYDPDDPWLDEHWECLSALLERLAGRL